MRGRLWLGLAWLLLARAPGAAGTPSSPRRPRSYPHLEGDVRWRRLLSSTHFFLRVDPGGRVQGTRWRHGADSIIEIRSIHVGVVALKAVHTGFYVAMNRGGHLYGSVSAARGASGGRVSGGGGVRWPTSHTRPPRSGSTLPTAGSRSASRRTATTPTPPSAGVTVVGPCSWRWMGRGPRGVGAGHSGTTCPPTSCLSWSPEVPRSAACLSCMSRGRGPASSGRGQARLVTRLFPKDSWSVCCVAGWGYCGTPTDAA
ncbi:fibroblast growth factor 22 isoform X1 [Mirounga leonina]|uniref:fibroblast growth factor 22 isoform X1 n=1 Tax=Mirounga leonina TaxID=9715 RepID=UPI00156C071E|nr:fibroblast growth factor 22 isoform X1 [Mirounga leonina]